MLEAKLKQKGIHFDICDSVEEMEKRGYTTVPMLVSDNNKEMNFSEAVQWLNSF